MFARQPIFRTSLGLAALLAIASPTAAQELSVELPVGPSRPISLP